MHVLTELAHGVIAHVAEVWLHEVERWCLTPHFACLLKGLLLSFLESAGFFVNHAQVEHEALCPSLLDETATGVKPMMR